MIKAKARVQITVETEVVGWGDDCSIGQLYKQAAESGIEAVRTALKPGEHGRIYIVGEPKVTAIITETT